MSSSAGSQPSTPNWLSAVAWMRCPRTGATLVASGDRLISTDRLSRLAYPVLDGIPVLLADRGVELSVEEWTSATSGDQ